MNVSVFAEHSAAPQFLKADIKKGYSDFFYPPYLLRRHASAVNFINHA